MHVVQNLALKIRVYNHILMFCGMPLYFLYLHTTFSCIYIHPVNKKNTLQCDTIVEAIVGECQWLVYKISILIHLKS